MGRDLFSPGGVQVDFLAGLENSGFATWVRESPSVWAYPSILFLHTIGLGFLVGASAAIDLRILGFARRLPLAPMEDFFLVLWIGFWLNAISGFALVMADATSLLTNPVFYVKMGFIVLSLASLRLIRSRVFRDPLVEKGQVRMTGKVLAAASLIFWLGAITAGRLTAYLFSTVGL
jgi:hypothetical protein